MDVKEYTLYQKWCEIQQKYPTELNNTLFGEERQLIDPSQQILVDEVKSNIWMPNGAEDYENLEPMLIYTDDSGKFEKQTPDATNIGTGSVASDAEALGADEGIL